MRGLIACKFGSCMYFGCTLSARSTSNTMLSVSDGCTRVVRRGRITLSYGCGRLPKREILIRSLLRSLRLSAKVVGIGFWWSTSFCSNSVSRRRVPRPRHRSFKNLRSSTRIYPSADSICDAYRPAGSRFVAVQQRTPGGFVLHSITLCARCLGHHPPSLGFISTSLLNATSTLERPQDGRRPHQAS